MNDNIVEGIIKYITKYSESNDIEKLCILKQSDISVTEYIIKRANELLDEQS